MKYFYAVYQISEVKYTSFIYAPSFNVASSLAEVRNIGEVITGILEESNIKRGFDPQPLPSQQYKDRRLVPCAHTLAFYTWIACRAKVLKYDHTLCDDGMLHEVLHELEFPEQYGFRVDLHNRMTILESSIPGLNVKLN